MDLGPLQRIFNNPFKAHDEIVPVPACCGDVQLLRIVCDTSDQADNAPYATPDDRAIWRWTDETTDGPFVDCYWSSGWKYAYNLVNYMQVDVPCVYPGVSPCQDAAFSVMPFDSIAYGVGRNTINPTYLMPSYMPTSEDHDWSWLRRWVLVYGNGEHRGWLLSQGVRLTAAKYMRTDLGSTGLSFWQWYSHLPMIDASSGNWLLNLNFYNECGLYGHERKEGVFVLNNDHPQYVFRRPYFSEDADGFDMLRTQCWGYDATYNKFPHTAPKMSFLFANRDTGTSGSSYKVKVVSWLLVESKGARFPTSSCRPITGLSWMDVHKLSSNAPIMWTQDEI